MLQASWVGKMAEAEIKSYLNLGVQNYYLGKVDRAKYYTGRAAEGKIEAGHSKLKLIALE